MNRCAQSKLLFFLFIHCIVFASSANALQTRQKLSLDDALQNTLNARSHPYTNKTTFLTYKKTLNDLYFLSPQRLLWLKQQNRDNQSLQAILDLLSRAKFSGLNADHYNLSFLQALKIQLQNQDTISSTELAWFDTAISINLLHFLSDLHFGRIDPKKNNFNFKIKKTPETFVPLILESIEKDELELLIDKVEPRIALYKNLKQALTEFLNKQEHWQQIHLKYKTSLHPGDSAHQISDIRKQLMSINRQTKQNKNLSQTYDTQLQQSIIEFQYLHGLTPDGIIGKKTILALNISLPDRIQKIELALERFRWLPQIKPGPIIIVNIPAYQLWAYNTTSKNTSESLTMKVIVGESIDKQSPVFSADLHYLEFAPYWNIPHSITVEDILPKLLENDLYLEQQEMELVTGFHNNSPPIPYSDDTFEQLKQGSIKLRQRPGYKNALGRVKFIFPNEHAVYLHDTPSQGLFNRSKRDFSHGCIRIEKPTELATFLLKSKSGWDKQRIRRAMHLENPKKVQIKKPVPVILFYSTTAVIQDQLFFYDDIYQYDAKLKQAILAHNKATAH